MPVYEYEHRSAGECALGHSFERTQTMYSAPFTLCPECGQPVRKLISLASINTPKTNSDLKSMGFTKLVRRDHGVYENVTATGNESKIWDTSRPETMPDLKKKISD
jgi:putative FmdB family regulatory protein